jgi:HK97 family phage prohead protease
MIGLELREASDGRSWRLTGLASTYEQAYAVTDMRGSYKEKIARGAFRSALAGEHDVQLYVQHNHTVAPLAMTPSRRGLTLADTQMGLGLEAVLLREDPEAAAAASKVRRGVLGELSIGFQVPDNGDSWAGDIRTVSTAKLIEISLVSKAANPSATVETIRTADGGMIETRSVPITVRQDGIGVSGGPVSESIENEGDGGEECPECDGTGRIGDRTCPACNGTGVLSDDGDDDDEGDRMAQRGDKYSAAEKQAMLKKGHALANANGDPSFPIEDADDLRRAIRAVGRGSRSPERIRQHVMKRARALGLMRLIPDSWQADGSIKRWADLDALELELRAMCHHLPPQRSSAAERELERMSRKLRESRRLEKAFLAPTGTWRV